jgi:DNA-binding NarL/FixJ family response regulator
MGLRILIIDDSHVVRNGIRFLLSSCHEFAICGEAGDGAEGLLKTAELRPDVILLDLSLPDKNGLEIVPGLRRELPKTRILVMSADVWRWFCRAPVKPGRTDA